MKILIITAMKEELLPIIKDFKVADYKISFYNEVYINEENRNKLYFSYTGIGKVNASMSTTILINEIKPDLVINLGTAGGIDVKVDILDLVIADKLAYHDVDVTAFGYQKGQVPQNDTYLETDINKYFIEEVEKQGINVHVGTIVSGDQFINDRNTKIKITSNFDNVYAVEMESTAIVDVCNKLDVKSLVIRGISDLAHGNSTMEFDKYLEQVVKKFRVIIKILQHYEFI